MLDPVFKLDGIVHSKDTTEDFEGPLSLILQLLAKNKVEISEISISDILTQYLDYLAELQGMDIEVASEFVAMASHLAYIKSRVLVAGENEEVSELNELISSLEQLRRKDEYSKIKTVAPLLAELYKTGAGYIVKPAEFIPGPQQYEAKYDKQSLLKAVIGIFSEAPEKTVLTHQSYFSYPKPVIYSVSRKAAELIQLLTEYGNISVSGLFDNCEERSELVATFLCILEMSKSGAVKISPISEDIMLELINSDFTLSPEYYSDIGEENGNS